MPCGPSTVAELIVKICEHTLQRYPYQLIALLHTPSGNEVTKTINEHRKITVKSMSVVLLKQTKTLALTLTITLTHPNSNLHHNPTNIK